MASSRITLDVDNLTFDTLFIKNANVVAVGKSSCGNQGFSSNINISSYTIPIIPGNSNIRNEFQYATPEQVFSIANILLTPSSIPDVIAGIQNLSTVQVVTNAQVSSISTTVGYQIIGVISTVDQYQSSIYGTTFNSSYSTFYSSYTAVQLQNLSTLEVFSQITNLGTSLSTLSTIVASSFSTLGIYLDTTFNQGPTVSTLSTYVYSYYSSLSGSVELYSTNTGLGLFTTGSTTVSSIIGFTSTINTIITVAFGPGASSLSTTVGSTFSQLSYSLQAFDTGTGISSLSTLLTSSLSSFSTTFDLYYGTPGICSISTTVACSFSTFIQNAPNYTGISGLSSLSTFTVYNLSSLTFQILTISSSAGTLSTFSTVLGKQIKMISDMVCTIGVADLFLQQVAVEDSLSTLSSVFGSNYNNLATLSSFSTLLPTTYSTIAVLFNSESQISTLSSLTRIQNTTFSNISTYISSAYPAVFTGPGVSSLSSLISPNISSISTSVYESFSSFSNAIYNISSIRTDPGVSAISTFFTTSTLVAFSSFSTLNYSTQIIAQTNLNILNSISSLRAFDIITYSTFNPNIQVSTLQSSLLLLNQSISSILTPLQTNSSNLSTTISTQGFSLFSSYSQTTSSFFSTLSAITLNYQAVSTFVVSSIIFPTFSSFNANLITSSNLTVTQQFNASSIGINLSTTSEFPLAIGGSLRISAPPLPLISHVAVGSNTLVGGTIFTSSNAFSNYVGGSTGAFMTQGNGVAYNGSLWVAVGSNFPTQASLLYSSNPNISWSAGSIPNNMVQLKAVAWNGSYWLAAGGNAPNSRIIYSSNGTTWTQSDSGFTASLPSFVSDLAWNGYRWVATSVDTTNAFNTLFYSSDGQSWSLGTATTTTLFRTFANSIATNGVIWVAVGGPNETTTIKYGYTGSDWNDVSGPQFSTSGLSVRWNGDKFVAVGMNGNTSNIMYSFTGTSWNYANNNGPGTFISTAGTSVVWNGNVWKASGIQNSSLSTIGHLISYDAINWSSISVSTNVIYGQAFASNTTPTIQLSNFDIFSSEIPSMMNNRKRMNVIQSTIYFNDGDFTIRHLVSTQNLGYIGINTTYPQYALDIAVGNARKPSGTTWLTASDARVKTDIQPADLYSCAKIVESLSVKNFKFTQEYQTKTGVSADPVYGFIAQEVKEILPKAISYTNEYGHSDFHSLDTDQIFKLEFGATQYLLQKVQQMESEVSTLECRLKNLPNA